MAFSHESVREIWRRAGKNPRCVTCGVSVKDGWNLDCSHLDHTRNEHYDDPAIGCLECLQCHLLRHISMLFDIALTCDQDKIAGAKSSCLKLIWRIVNGDDRRHEKGLPRGEKEIFEARQHLDELLTGVVQDLISMVSQKAESPLNIEVATLYVYELIYSVRTYVSEIPMPVAVFR